MIWPWQKRQQQLESELEWIRGEYRILLAAFLEKAGAREAANMLMGPVQITVPKAKEAAKAINDTGLRGRVGWRTSSAEVSNATREFIANDSVSKLQHEIEAKQ